MAQEQSYPAKLASLTDQEFVEEVGNKCWLSAFAANNPRSKYHAEADACYSEAQRRGKPWLYQQGWNSAYRSSGYEPSEQDLAAARLSRSPTHDQ